MQLVREFAGLARVTAEDVERLAGMAAPAGASTPAPRAAAPARSTAPIASSQERNLLRCVLAKPELAAELDDELLDPAQPETAVLRAIAELDSGDAVSGAWLVERFQGTEHEPVVFQAQASQLGMELGEQAAGEEFRQIQLALRIKRVHAEIDELNRRAAADPALRPELSRRLVELRLLKEQRS
jgi:hypothetical protein